MKRSELNLSTLWLVGGVAAISAMLVVAGLLLGPVYPDSVDAKRFELNALVFALFVITTLAAGMLISWRRPGHLIGWLLLVQGALWAISVGASGAYGSALPDSPETVPAGRLLVWVDLRAGDLGFAAFIFLCLLFPTGRLRSPRWRPVAWLGVMAVATLIGVQSLEPGPLAYVVPVENPFAVQGVGQTLHLIEIVASIGVGFAFVAAVVSLILRLRSARGEERAQIKWFTYSAGVLFVGVFCYQLTSKFIDGAPRWISTTEVIPWPLGFLALPVSVSIAVLKYHLYDIDHIINKTLVYGVLTAILVSLNLSLILVLQRLLAPVVSGSDLVVAGSTLAMAGLFQPLRSRIQTTVDRRFYRHKYNATQTLEAFSARLREEIDLNALLVELAEVVQETMEPEHISLWLRKTTS